MSIVVRTDEELMAEFEAKSKAAKAAGTAAFDAFFFFLKEDEKAIIRPLLNIPQVTLTEMLYHEKYDMATGKMVADNACAQSFGKQCALCREAKATGDKKLKAAPRVFLPVYVHQIQKNDLFGKPVAVTAKDADGIERPIKGVRMLKLKLGSAILDDLKGAYYDSSDEPAKRTILASDFSIARSGSGLDTKYTTTLRNRTLPIEEQLLPFNAEKVISDVRLHREEQAIETESDLEEDGRLTVEEALDLQPPTEKQLQAIKKLCKVLDKDYVEPLSFSQAKSLLDALMAEYNEMTGL